MSTTIAQTTEQDSIRRQLETAFTSLDSWVWREDLDSYEFQTTFGRERWQKAWWILHQYEEFDNQWHVYWLDDSVDMEFEEANAATAEGVLANMLQHIDDVLVHVQDRIAKENGMITT